MGYSLIDKGKIRWQFGRAAHTYDNVSRVQNSMADSLLESVGDISGKNVIDLGCGTGYMLEELENRRPASLVGVDISTRMLAIVKNRTGNVSLLTADMDHLPIADNCFDCVLSNAALQWCDLGRAVGEMKRLLRPGGNLLVTTFGPSTLSEWKTPDGGGLPTMPLPSTASIEAVLTGHGFNEIRLVNKCVKEEYQSVDEMFSAIRNLGATFAGAGRHRGLMGRQRYMQIRSRFEIKLAKLGTLSLTFEPIVITAVG